MHSNKLMDYNKFHSLDLKLSVGIQKMSRLLVKDSNMIRVKDFSLALETSATLITKLQVGMFDLLI